MEKILVTGADGFIGSHLVEQLVSTGHRVKALTLYNSSNSWGCLEYIPKNILDEIEVIDGDVRDYDFLRNNTRDVTDIFHLAALISIPYSYISSFSYVNTNMLGTLNILQIAKEKNVQRLLVTSTSEVYGTAKYVPMDETHPLQAQSPYSASKIAADKLAESFYRSFSVPVSIVRPFNTYGPRQSLKAIIPTLINQLVNDSDEINVGLLTPTRDFNYVLDTVQGFIEIWKSDKTIGEEINISTGNEVSIKDVLDLLLLLTGSNAVVKEDKTRIRPSSSEVYRLVGDNSKIKKLTKWQNRYSLQHGLKETIEWYSKNSTNKHKKYNI